MATEETTISDLELTEDILPDMLTPVENASETKATTFSAIKNWLAGFFVSKTGNETIAGKKTFRDILTVTRDDNDQAYIQLDNNTYAINTGNPSPNKYSGYVFRDKNGTWLGFVRWGHTTTGYNSIQMCCVPKSGSGSNAILEIGFDSRDKAFLKTQNISLDATDNSTNLATTNWVNTRINDYIIETGVSENNWWRKYKSGWIEQGGKTQNVNSDQYTITFPKPMANTNYYLNFVCLTTTQDQAYFHTYTPSTTSAVLREFLFNNAPATWYLCGQGA